MKRLLATLMLFAMSTGSYAMIIYQNDFQSGDTDGWRGGFIDNGVYRQEWDNGFFGIGAGWEDINFRLRDPDVNTRVDLMFDVITYGNWEQSGSAEDEFEVTARIVGLFNDEEIFEGTLNDGLNSLMFTNVPTYRLDDLRLRFEADVTSDSEYFGLDNFKVLTPGGGGGPGGDSDGPGALTEPGTLAIFLMGLAGVVASRRRIR